MCECATRCNARCPCTCHQDAIRFGRSLGPHLAAFMQEPRLVSYADAQAAALRAELDDPAAVQAWLTS